MTELRKNPAQVNDSAIIRTFPIKFPQAWISSCRSSLLTSLSGQNTSDKVPGCKFFNASTAHFSSLSFTLPTKAVPCGAIPCQLSFIKWVSTARLSMAQHGNTSVYTDETSGVVSCRAVLTHCFGYCKRGNREVLGRACSLQSPVLLLCDASTAVLPVSFVEAGVVTSRSCKQLGCWATPSLPLIRQALLSPGYGLDHPLLH